MSLSAISDAYKAEQERLNRSAARELVRIFPTLNMKDLDRTAPGWMYAVESATEKHYARSQQLASDVYSDVRREAGATSRVEFASPEMDKGALRASLTWGGPHSGKKLMGAGGMMADVAGVVLAQTTRTALRFGANGGRQMMAATAKKDPATTGRYGYIRVPGVECCGFCAMCAMQVYNSMDTANGVFHDDDRCTALPRIGDAIPDGYADRMRDFEDVYVQERAYKPSAYFQRLSPDEKRAYIARFGEDASKAVDAKQTARNMNRYMRERYGA